jgi:hypothetical protein
MSSIRHNQKLYNIVVSHYLLAAICFLAISVMFCFSAEAFSGHYFQPKILALTHTIALGWGSMLIFGALYQLLPVILETDLFNLRISWFSFALFVPGIFLLVCSFWFFHPGIYMQLGGILVFLAIVLFSANVFLTGRNKKKGSIYKMYIFTACLWLVLTAFLGVLMVFNFSMPFLPKVHMHFLRLHAHMGIVGWFLMLIIGVSAKLLPMFLVCKYQKTHLLSYSYYLINLALLLFIIDGYLYGINLKTYFFVGLGVVGLCFYMVYIGKCFLSRLRKNLDLPMVNTLLSFIFLAAAIVILPFILHYNLKHDTAAVNLSLLYGILLFMGWISALILGQTFKTLPFIVWVKHYEHLTGKVKTPLPADLLNNTLLYIQSIAFIIFSLAFMAGILFSLPVLKYIGICSLFITAISYGINVACLLLHKTKTKVYDHI